MKKVDQMDEFTKYVMDEAGLESPSKNFVSNIMAQVRKQPKFVATPAKLISPKMWWLIGLAFTALSIYLVLNWQDQILSNYSGVFDDYLISLDSVYNGLDVIQFSNTFVWCFLLFGVLLLVQGAIIKNYSNKKLSS